MLTQEMLNGIRYMYLQGTGVLLLTNDGLAEFAIIGTSGWRVKDLRGVFTTEVGTRTVIACKHGKWAAESATEMLSKTLSKYDFRNEGSR